MSIISTSSALGFLGAGAGATYQISRSLRFNSADSAYLSRTPRITARLIADVK
jgi:hypothetical protein